MNLADVGATMFTSVAAAEKAAIEGEGGEDFDTQKCLELQRDILSSSLSNTQDDCAVLGASKVNNTCEHQTEPPLPSSGNGRTSNLSHHSHAHLPRQIAERPENRAAPSVLPPALQNCDEVATSQGWKTSTIKRKGKGQPRLYGTEIPLEATANQTRHVMSQRSNASGISGWSLTQENPSYAYAQYECAARADGSATDEITTDPPTSSELMHPPTNISYHESAIETLKLHHASAITDSTSRTYGENDVGHVDFGTSDLVSIPYGTDAPESQEPVSQDAPFAPHTEQQSTRYFDPETPAPPVNPFTRKGSVLKGHEMFGATQPSSIGRPPLSAASSRPSPDMYNATHSPTGLRSSPLLRRFEPDGNMIETETSPLQSSVRGLLVDRFHHSLSPESNHTPLVPRTSGIQSFNGGPGLQRTNSLPEPQVEYVSVKESQERRRNLTSSMQQDSNDEDDSDMDSESRKYLRRKEKERKVQKELAAVELNRRPGFGSRSSTREVEVPSTGKRRRSVQEEYIAQCEGFDARDTQQEDFQQDVEDTQQDGVIADSQVAPESQEPTASDKSSRKVIPSWNDENLNGSTQSPSLPPHVSHLAEAERVPELDSNSRTDEPTSDPPRLPLQSSALPLQELSGNGTSFRTPQPQKTHTFSDGADVNIPETSPPEDRLRPMGDIATISFEAGSEDDRLQNIPGFTPDPDLNQYMRESAPPEFPRHSIVPFKATVKTAVDRRSSDARSAASILSTTGTKDLRPEKSTEAVPIQLSDQDQGEVRDGEVAPVEAHISSSPPDSSEPIRTRGRNRSQAKASAKALQEAADRAEERRQSKIAFRKRQIEEGREYEPDESDEEEGVKETLDEFKKVLEQKKASSKKKSRLLELSPDPLASDDSHQRPPKENNGRGKAQMPVVVETPQAGRGGSRTKKELKGPSRALRRSDLSPAAKRTESPRQYGGTRTLLGTSTPRSSTRISKPVSVQKGSSTRSSKRSSRFTNLSGTPDSSPLSSVPPSAPATSSADSAKQKYAAINDKQATDAPRKPAKRTSKRKSTVAVVRDEEDIAVTSKISSRISKRKSTVNTIAESEIKPTPKHTPRMKKATGSLFNKMAFAISYSHEEKEKKDIIHMIQQQGGYILEDGFECLLEISTISTGSRSARYQSAEEENCSLTLSAMAQDLGFTALIAEGHSRKAKYMQALALGLPCLSGRWVFDCVAKDTILDWNPYLLCAGQSSFLGNVIRSRTLPRYSAADASFACTFAAREKLLDGKSIVLISGKGRAAEEKRKAYIFLARVLGPSRLVLVPDLVLAREKLLEAESNGREVHCLYAENDSDGAKDAVFGFAAGRGTQKRKRSSTAVESAGPAPKRIKVISDEFVIQSLILGQLIEEA